jgi:hypothetical protein
VPLSCNLGTLTSWNPLGHSRPVTGLLYLLHNKEEPIMTEISLKCSAKRSRTVVFFKISYELPGVPLGGIKTCGALWSAIPVVFEVFCFCFCAIIVTQTG